MEIMRDHELRWRKGIGNRRGMKNKEDEYSQWVWIPEAATAEGWKELVFHFCDGRNWRQLILCSIFDVRFFFFKKKDEGALMVCKSTVGALIPLTADQGCWKRENKINVKSRKEETCDVHKCIVLYFACYLQDDL